jgi:hypothetical protein
LGNKKVILQLLPGTADINQTGNSKYFTINRITTIQKPKVTDAFIQLPGVIFYRYGRAKTSAFINRTFIESKTLSSTMKLCISLLFSLFFLQTVESELYLAVVTLVNKTGLTSTQLQSVNSTLTADKTLLTDKVNSVATSFASSFASGTWDYSESPHDVNRLRGRALQSCNLCLGFPTGFYCYWNGRWRPACRRELEVYKALDEAALSKLSKEDRRRHLQMGDMCDFASNNVTAQIKTEISAGKITAPLASFSIQCLSAIV